MPIHLLLRKCLLFLFCLLLTENLLCQLRWDGEAGDGSWTNALNWSGDQLPGEQGDVLLDNNLVAGNYMVYLPAGNTAIRVRSLTLSPANGMSIQLKIPATNVASPAFSATGPGNSIVLNNGGIFVNASGATGATISVADSFCINSGGRYTHQSRSAHAQLVTQLCRRPGTERGIFEFDVPGGGYTIAASGRTYGSLLLNGLAAGGEQVYSCSAANPFFINGDLTIQNGVTFNLDVSSNTSINGNLVQNGGLFNLASAPHTNNVILKGHLLQAAGTITSAVTGKPSLIMGGNGLQLVENNGSINDSVKFIVNNPAGIQLISDLTLPCALQLQQGIVRANGHLVSLQASCTIVADSLSEGIYVDGPLRKSGLSNTNSFLFPVGKANTQRWVALKQATGDFTVEFMSNNPNNIGNTLGAGLDHISALEYWLVQPAEPDLSSAGIALSFNNVNSGGVTDVSALRVAGWNGTAWLSEGNILTTGTAGSDGSVVGDEINTWLEGANYFTLGSSMPQQNPLPVRLLFFDVTEKDKANIFNWQIATGWSPPWFELEAASGTGSYITLAHLDAKPGQTRFAYNEQHLLNGPGYYRLKAPLDNGNFFYSEAIKPQTDNMSRKIIFTPSITRSNTELSINSELSGSARLAVCSMDGRLVDCRQVSLIPGNNNITLRCGHFAAGMYIVSLTDPQNKITTGRFIKSD